MRQNTFEEHIIRIYFLVIKSPPHTDAVKYFNRNIELIDMIDLSQSQFIYRVHSMYNVHNYYVVG